MSLDASAYQGVLLGQKAQITSEIARLQNEIDADSKLPQTMKTTHYLNTSDVDQEESLTLPRDKNGNYYQLIDMPSDAANQIAVDQPLLAKYQDQLKTLGYQIDGQQQVIASSTSSKTSGPVTSAISNLSTQAQKIFSSSNPLMLVALVIIGILVVGKL